MAESFNIDTKFPEAVFIKEGVQQALKDIVDENMNVKVVDANSTGIAADLASIRGNTGIISLGSELVGNYLYTQYRSGTVTYIEKMDMTTFVSVFSPNDTAWADKETATYATRNV